jgi:hypothetical protein
MERTEFARFTTHRIGIGPGRLDPRESSRSDEHGLEQIAYDDADPVRLMQTLPRRSRALLNRLLSN